MARRRRKTRNPPGQGSVFQRRDGQWVARIVVDGTRRQRYAPDEDTARAYLADLKLDAGFPPDALITVREFLARWLRSVEPSIKPRAFEAYQLNVRRWSVLLGDARLCELTAEQIEAGQRTMQTKGVDVRVPGRTVRGEHPPKPLSAQTIKQARTVLHTALQYAVDPPRCWLVRNPVDGVAVPRVETREMLTLDDTQIRTLFERTKGDPLHPLWVLIATSGIRLGEALGLRWGDIDWKGGRIVIVQQTQRQIGKGIVTQTPKRKRSRRPVAVPASTLELLREHQRTQAETRLQALVFCRPDGRPIDPPDVRPLLHEITTRLGLPDVRVHDLRHSYATALLTRKQHPKIVSEQLGHSSIAITLDLYSHVLEGMGADAAESLEDLFSEPKGTGKVQIDRPE